MKPAASVIIPCYNHAHYLPQAIQSVLAQRFTDWEAIVVNDGSTDDTAAVVAQICDPRIRYVYQENQGLSAARNTGIRMAQGKYLAFVDADDEWEPRFLQRCVQVLDADAALAGVYTLNYFIDERGTVLPQIGGRAVHRGEFRRQNWAGGFFPPVSVLVRAEAVHQAGVFDEQLTSEEDWDLWLRIGLRYQMEGIPEPLARYRVYANSMSTNAARMHANRMSILPKYLGPPVGDPTTWPQEKRCAYAFAYWHSCIGYIQQGQPDEGWRFLVHAAKVWPDLFKSLDTLYELACGDKHWGERGQADLIDIEGNGVEILRRLDDLFAQAAPAMWSLRRAAYGNTYLALGILSDQAGQWAKARGYLVRAVAANPRLLASYSVVRRMIKLCSGQRLVRLMRTLQGVRAGSV